MVSHTGSVKILGGQGQGGVKQLSSAMCKRRAVVVSKRVFRWWPYLHTPSTKVWAGIYITSLARAAPHHEALSLQRCPSHGRMVPGTRYGTMMGQTICLTFFLIYQVYSIE